ncbi:MULTISPECIES: hypothetical protein [unclassified Streptomyces]|uniref:hypothetical protein n=1 Tax=unclassified Streptomyces TaxID=2593676 RepID=UPI003653F5D4
MEAVPADKANVDAVAERLRQILRESNEDMSAILRMSEVSFREWLSGVTTRIANRLGLAAAAVDAVIADACAIALNAKDAFLSSYERERDKRRRVQRRPRG